MTGDVQLPQFDDTYNGYALRTLVDTLENRLSNISRVSAFINKGAYQLTSDMNAVGNVNGGADTLITYTMQGNVLALDGFNIEIEAWGTVAANANNKTIILYFGSSVLYTTGVLAANNGAWKINAIVTRTGAATQKSIATIISSNTTIGYSASFNVLSEDLSANITIKCTGTGTATNDIVQQGLLIRLFQQQ